MVTLVPVCIAIFLTTQCLAQQMIPAQPDPRFNQPGNFQPMPVSGQNPQPIPVANPNMQPGSNPNRQPIPVTNRQSIPINSQPGQDPNNPVVMPAGQNPNAPPVMPQMPPVDQSEITCAQAGRSAVSQCFQQNGGFQMVTVIALLSNGTQGQLPPNSEQIKQTLCQSQGQIVACVFSSIAKFNNSQECSTSTSFIRLEQETVGLLNGIQQMCGKGLMPTVTPCMQTLNYDMMQCYVEAGLNPELFSPRGSRMEGAIIGDNREVARMFCGKRQQLNACQNRVLDKCEGAKLLQTLSGNDQVSVQLGNDVLCNAIDVYVSGLVCFQTPTAEVEACGNSMIRQMTEVTMKQIRDDLGVDEFMTEFCKARLNNLKCDSTAWSKSCSPVAVGLKREYQCNLLPSKCKNNPAIRELYRDACAESKFARGLRNKATNNQNTNNVSNNSSDLDSGAGSVMAGFTFSFTSVIAVLLLL